MERGFPGGSVGKESACNAENPGSVPGLGRSPGEVNGYALQYSCTQVFLPGESYGQRSLVGYSTWGHSVGHDWHFPETEDGSCGTEPFTGRIRFHLQVGNVRIQLNSQTPWRHPNTHTHTHTQQWNGVGEPSCTYSLPNLPLLSQNHSKYQSSSCHKTGFLCLTSIHLACFQPCSFWLLWIMLPWTFVSSLYGHIFLFILCIYPGVKFLGNLVTLCLALVF